MSSSAPMTRRPSRSKNSRLASVARAVGLAVLRIDEDQVDVGRDVELAAAELAHADDDEILRAARVVARLAVQRGERAVVERDRARAAPSRRASSCWRRPRRGRARPVRSRASVCRNTRRRSVRSAAASAAGSPRATRVVDRRVGRRPVERRVERRLELGALVRARGERGRRVAAVGEGVGEVDSLRHGIEAMVGRSPSRARLGRSAGASATMRQTAPLCLPRAPSSAPPARFASRWSAFSGRVVVVGFGCSRSRCSLVRFVVFPHVESYRDTLASTLAQELGHPVEIAALTTGWDGWNPKLVVQGFRVLDRARVRRVAAPRAARGRAHRRVDVAAAAGAAPQGARHRAAAARDPPRPRRASARGRHRDRSGAGARRLAAHRLDPAPARDRDPRRAHHVGRRSAQRAAARPRPRAVSPREPVRPPPLRLEGHAAGRARGAARPSRRPQGRLAEGLAARARARCSSGSTTPTSPRGANGCRCRRRSRAARARCASGSSSRTARRARSSPTSSWPTSRRGSATSCRSSTSRICRDAPAGAATADAARDLHASARVHDGRAASGSIRPISR